MAKFTKAQLQEMASRVDARITKARASGREPHHDPTFTADLLAMGFKLEFNSAGIVMRQGGVTVCSSLGLEGAARAWVDRARDFGKRMGA